MHFLLDTDTCIYALKSANRNLILRLKANEGSLATSTIVLHELYYGAEGYREPEKRLFLIDELAQRLTVLPFDRKAAAKAGSVRHSLQKTGSLIGSFDILIAATAIAHNLTLITGNEREFSRIDGLRLENWILP